MLKTFEQRKAIRGICIMCNYRVIYLGRSFLQQLVGCKQKNKKKII